MPVKEASVR